MKKQNPTTLIAALCCGFIACSTAVQAQTDLPVSTDAVQVSGSDSSIATSGTTKVVWTSSFLQLSGSTVVSSSNATITVSSSPATATLSGSSAAVSGFAEIESLNSNGKVHNDVKISEQGLPADIYTVTIIKKSDGKSLALGTFTVTPPTRKNFFRPYQFVIFGGASHPLPAGFDPADVSKIAIAGSGGGTVLSGDFSNAITDIFTSETVTITAGKAAPNAKGTVTVWTNTYKGVSHSQFHLEARNLPINSSYMLAINGADLQAVTTDAHGRLTVNKLPSTVVISTITSVSVHDSGSNVVLSASL